jgi:hypothetical protein
VKAWGRELVWTFGSRRGVWRVFVGMFRGRGLGALVKRLRRCLWAWHGMDTVVVSDGAGGEARRWGVHTCVRA